MAASSPTEWITALVAVIGVFGALFQYWRNSNITRCEASRNSALKAADEMERFHDDDAVRTALQTIEWESGYVQLKDAAGTYHRTFVDSQLFLLALRHHGEPRSSIFEYNFERDTFASKRKADGNPFEDMFSPQEQLLREVFDRYLNRLERIENLIRREVISPNHFMDYFTYWLELMKEDACPVTASHFSSAKRKALWHYIRMYQFNGVIRLFQRYIMSDR